MKKLIFLIFTLLPFIGICQNPMIQVIIASRKKPLPPDSVTITVTFSNTPNSASSDFAEIKYNKEGIFNFEIDDNKSQCLLMESILSNFHYTDGTGLNHNYTAATAINGYTFSGIEIGQNSGTGMIYAEYSTLISSGWDVMNHSNRHVDLINSNGINIIGYKEDILTLNELYFNNINYTINCFVVPSNYTNFVPHADELGFLVSSSSGNDPYKPAFPASVQVGTVSNIVSPDSGLIQLKRGFLHNWSDQAHINGFISHFKNMVDNSSPIDNKFYRVGTHADNFSSTVFTNFIDSLHNISGDRIWFTTAREWMEYRYCTREVVKKDTLIGNTLLIQLNYDQIREDIRWRDLSLNISTDATIIDVTFSGNADSLTYNPNSGLINVYKQNLIFNSYLLDP
tara:strand:- start:1393 stop:2583 length:1191 start_codon:yes stop_codon:yes gene_type:complete